jgi:peptidyl-prolyl cis-trans isomerase D
MFEFVRTHNRLLFFVLVLLIFPSFVFFGVQGYSRFDDPANETVATVDGQKITRAEWDAAHRRQIEQARSQAPGLDPKFFDTPEARRATLDNLVRERVLSAASARGHLSVSDERLMREVTSIPQLAALKRPDGSFDLDTYKAMVQAQGRSIESFEAALRQDLALRQITGAVAETGTAASAPARAAIDALLQERTVSVLRFDAKDQKAGIAPAEAELAAHHKANEAQFRTTEQVKIEYVVLDLPTLEKGIPAPEAELRKYYDENVKARYTTAEERRASHILVSATKDMPADARAKAKAKAEQLVADARKNSTGFADLARKSSEDTASAPQGGDLDFAARGGFVAKPLEDAVFAMKPGEVTGPVESEFGFHIVKLEATRGGVSKPYESVRAEIEAELKKQGAQKEFVAAAEQFGNLVNAQSDSLKPVADKLKLPVQSATVQRQPAPGSTGALASAKLLEAVFSSDSIAKKLNTEAIEFGANQLVAARVIEHQPSRVQPLADVMAVVRERVIAEQAAAKAKQLGQAKLAELQKADSTAGVPEAITVSRANPQNQAREVIEAVLRADAGKLPQWVGVDLGSQGYALARVSAVKPPAADAPQAQMLVPRYAQAFAAAEAQAYLKALERRLKVKVDSAAAAASAPAVN